MEFVSLASLSFASLLSVLPVDNDMPIERHSSPAIAGLWEIDLENHPVITPSQLELLGLDPSIETDTIHTLTVKETVTIAVGQSVQAGLNTVSSAVDNQCKEHYNFDEGNKIWSVSGAEWTYGQYVLKPIPNSLPIMAIRTLYDNNEPDCLGNQVDQTGETMLVFVDYQPEVHQMHWCVDNEGKQCFMHFKQILP